MTGPWQISGSARVPLDDMVKLDHLYVSNWTLWSDVQILLRTVPCVPAVAPGRWHVHLVSGPRSGSGAELRRDQPIGRLLPRRRRQARRDRLWLPVRRRARHALRAWGRSPLAGQVTIERLSGGSWRAQRSVQVQRAGTFLVRLPRKAATERLRARVGGETSLTWNQR